MREEDATTGANSQDLILSFCYFRTLSFPACMACYGLAPSGLFNCYESAADVRPTNEDTWLS